MMELKIKLIEFTNSLNELVKQIIDFEEVYGSLHQLTPSFVIANRSKAKIQMKGASSNRTHMLMRYINFVKLLNPEVYSHLPKNLDVANADQIIDVLLQLPSTRSSNSCFYKSNDSDRSINGKDILEGRCSDSQLIDRLNAMGDLRKPDGHERDKDENVLSALINHLGLDDFDKDNNIDFSAEQFYFTAILRMKMNLVLKDSMDLLLLFYNIANFIYLKLLLIPTSPRRDEQSEATKAILDGNILALKHVFENSLLNKFPAFKDTLDNLTASGSVEESMHNEIELRKNVTFASIKESHTVIENWQNILRERAPKILAEQDRLMSNMMLILLRFDQELEVLNSKVDTLCNLSEVMRKYLPKLKVALENTRKQAEIEAADQKVIRANIPRRSSANTALRSSLSAIISDTTTGKEPSVPNKLHP